MDKDYNLTMADVRLRRAKELLEDAKHLLDNGSYKSANNRAFYAIEKVVKYISALKTEQGN